MIKQFSTLFLLTACCAFIFVLPSLASGLGGWSDPSGGWDLLINDFKLDEWSHDNGSDAWDGSVPGEAGKAPGGINVEVVSGAGDPSGDATVISIEDAGDPRGAGFADPSNRKIYLTHGIDVEGNFYENGITFIARFRINPKPVEAPANGYTLHDGGKGMVGIVHHAAPGNLSFALDTGGLLYFGNETQPALNVGDEFKFHAVWATAKLVAAGSYSAKVYVDGGTEPAFSGDIALGTGSDGTANYIAIGLGSTGRDGAVQIDYLGYKAGVNPPAVMTAVNPGAKLPSLWGGLKSN